MRFDIDSVPQKTDPEMRCLAGWPALRVQRELYDRELLERFLTTHADQLIQVDVAGHFPFPQGWGRVHERSLDGIRVEGEPAFSVTERVSHLLEASVRGSIPAVQYLASCGVELDARDEDGSTALVVASANGHAELVGSLLELGVDVDRPTGDGETPLHVAARRDNVAVVEALLKDGADVNARDDVGYSPLIWAAGLGRCDVVERLLAAGADVTLQGRDGMTALLFAKRR